jgi:hypothetical protein
VKPSEKIAAKAKEKIILAAEGITSGVYDAKPEYYQCLACAFMEICPATAKEL